MSKFLRIALVLVIALSCVNPLMAQKSSSKVPVENIGIGASIGSVGGLGGSFAYALQENLHVGSYFGLDFITGDGDSQSFLLFAPYAKLYVFEPIRNFRPFAMAQFVFETRSMPHTDTYTGEIKYKSESNSALCINFGGQWFPYSSVGVYAGVRFIGFNFDPTEFSIGIGDTFLGIEWFL